MNQSLFHDSLSDALTEVVKALGGHKVVGAMLKPEKTPDSAGRWLLDCLNPSRAERLDPDQVLFIMREGRKANCHASINYVLRDCGYADAQPIEPEDERARLQREFINAVAVVQQLGKRLEAV